MQTDEEVKSPPEPSGPSISFKKPILIGKIGRLPRTIRKAPTKAEVKEMPPLPKEDPPEEVVKTPAQQIAENTVPLPYKEPVWSGLPETPSRNYCFEVLKAGSIIENVDLMGRTFWVFGRLGSCDISMAHPTISRYHAVLQYRAEPTESDPRGFYLYDLNSTHGTFLNKNRLKSRVYVRVQVGHIIKLGCSTRNYILAGPEEDTEAVSDLSVTELKQLRAQQILDRQREQEEAELKAKEEAELRKKKEAEKGVDWGMGEDADEETDLAENPYAQTNNEELYLDDPKKALRGFMEREGFDLEYDCSEQGIGQFLCKVVLPIDDDRGRPIVAELLHKGKKKEAVVQCALEACRILDRHGLLRQATHESRKRKAKNWEENDFYDSDDDTFLDRTGTVEKKRENRMKAKIPQQPETYTSLLEKSETLTREIKQIEVRLDESKHAKIKPTSETEDSLDAYMNDLKQPKLDKEKATKLKTELHRLKSEYANVARLINFAKPADLPPLEAAKDVKGKGKLPLFGKRIKIKVQKPAVVEVEESLHESEEEEVEEDEGEFEERLAKEIVICLSILPEDLKNGLEGLWNVVNAFSVDEVEKGVKYVDGLTGTCDPRFLVRLKKLLKEIGGEKTKLQIKQEALNIFKDVKNEYEAEVRLKEAKDEQKSKTKTRLQEEENSGENVDSEKKRKKNIKRIQHRQEKNEAVRMKGYEEDAQKEDYSMWVPPEGQTGDGRTSLNEKFGY